MCFSSSGYIADEYEWILERWRDRESSVIKMGEVDLDSRADNDTEDLCDDVQDKKWKLPSLSLKQRAIGFGIAVGLSAFFSILVSW